MKMCFALGNNRAITSQELVAYGARTATALETVRNYNRSRLLLLLLFFMEADAVVFAFFPV